MHTIHCISELGGCPIEGGAKVELVKAIFSALMYRSICTGLQRFSKRETPMQATVKHTAFPLAQGQLIYGHGAGSKTVPYRLLSTSARISSETSGTKRRGAW